MKLKNIITRLWEGRALRREFRLMFRLALPLMLGEMSSMLMRVVSTMMLGRVGKLELAAQSLGDVIYVSSMLLVWGSVRILPSPIAEAHELKDGKRLKTLIGACVYLLGAFGLICSLLLGIGIWVFPMLRQDPSVGSLATQYLHYILMVFPTVVLWAMLVNIADALNYVRITMIVSFLGLLIDTLANWLLIFGNLGCPKMGLNGVAVSIGIAHACMCLILASFLYRQEALYYARNAIINTTEVWYQFLRFLKVGIPSGLQIIVEVAAFSMGTVIIGQISATQQAANQIALNLVSLTYVTILGTSTAGMIRVGQGLAYKSRVRIWLAGVANITLSSLIMLIPMALFCLIPEKIAAIYVQDSAVIAVATTLLVVGSGFQLADAVQASAISLLRAVGDVLVPSFLSIASFWVVGVPLGYWLAVVQGWNAVGIWVGYLVALIIQAFLFAKRFFYFTKTYSASSQ